MRPETRRWREFLFAAALVVFWVTGCAFALYLKRSQLLIGFDGGYMRSLAQRQLDWDVSIFSASIDLLQGLGDIFFPVNFRLFPAFIAASRFGSEIFAPVVTYGVVLAEFTIATIFFGRQLGTSRPVSFAATLLTCLIMFPLANPSLLYPILPLSPTTGTTIAVALVMGGAFLAFGRANWSTDLAPAALLLAGLVWWLLASPTILILGAPFLLLCGVSGVLAATSSAERWRKIGLFLGLSVLLLVTGPALYVVGLVVDTAATTFPLELANDRATFMYASVLFQWKMFGPTGPLLVCFAIAGAVLSIFDRQHPTLRMFAITLITYLVSRLTFAVLTIIFDFWRGPSPLYFEFFVIPLYAIFAIQFFAHALKFVWRILGWQPPSARRLELGLAAASVMLAIILAVTTRSNDYNFPYPPKATPFTNLIAQQSSVRPGAPFRGRTANMTSQTIEHNVTWFDLHNRDGALTADIGNEMRVAGLHAFGIPSLFEYTPTITPAFYAITSRFLALPGDSQLRSVSVLRRIDLRILAMLGVRFVITDAPVNGATASLRASLPVKGATLYLYEIERPNLGDYSPTVVRKPTTATDIINRLSDSTFDPSREIIADFTGNDEGLVPASGSRLTFDGGSLRVEAESTGRSILLLPLEFSRCLKTNSSQSGGPLIFRANLLETGVLFSGRLDASLSVRTGPFFLNPGCRLKDYFDMTALQVGKVPQRLDASIQPGK